MSDQLSSADHFIFWRLSVKAAKRSLNPCSRKEPVDGNWRTHLIKEVQVLTKTGTNFPTFGLKGFEAAIIVFRIK